MQDQQPAPPPATKGRTWEQGAFMAFMALTIVIIPISSWVIMLYFA